MKKIIIAFASIIFITSGIYAQTKKDGTPDMRYSSNKQYSAPIYSSPSPSPSYTNGRPVYSGQTHTESHDGNYIGQQNSQSHKGGTYVNPKSNNNYGIHKTK